MTLGQSHDLFQLDFPISVKCEQHLLFSGRRQAAPLNERVTFANTTAKCPTLDGTDHKAYVVQMYQMVTSGEPRKRGTQMGAPNSTTAGCSQTLET